MLKKTSSLFVGNATAESIQSEGEQRPAFTDSLYYLHQRFERPEAVIITPKPRFRGFEFDIQLVRLLTVLGPRQTNHARIERLFFWLRISRAVPEGQGRGNRTGSSPPGNF